ncbi:MAG: cation:proton antiporter subunit C [Bacteroidetes bacterium]|nr:cation:proton antiporter subunit C [Bacteroidota bacterium]MBU1423102.1 cation:proton antiporter subunit C [Bacteroidota bacterium]MBU2471993.1 cation:proton antiporter subunit C [Bacteroidota bacterium]MBU2637276.1 cation:proton antiporter subunit C [Bacteroidota bacterium]
MTDFFIGHVAYYFIVALLVIGLYGMLFKKNFVKKLIGMNILQSSVILFYVVSASKYNATVPVIDLKFGSDPIHYINPLPHTLMLTAIVVSVATTGVALALLIVIYKRFQTLNEDELLERMK